MLLRYGIIGTGAIGGFYGGRLANAGKDVHFLFHRDYDFVREHGLQVDSCDGSFHLSQVNAYSSTSQMPKCDVVLVALKSVRNQLLNTLLPPLLHEKTILSTTSATAVSILGTTLVKTRRCLSKW